MKLVCLLKSKKTTPSPLVICESDDVEALRSRALEYANSNPSFRHSWNPSGAAGEALSIDFDYCLEIRP